MLRATPSSLDPGHLSVDGRPVVQAGAVAPTRGGFRSRWWIANAIGFTIGHVVYSLVGHGVTGPHGDQLTSAQYLAHTFGLIGAALIVFSLQRAALRPHMEVTTRRIIVATGVFVAAFWLGAETSGPPGDWILGFTVLGTASWIGRSNVPRYPFGAAALTVLAFWAGIATAVVTMFATVRFAGFNPDSETLLNHTVFWVLLGGVTGAAGGYYNGWPLSRVVVSSVRKPAEVRVIATEDR
jgi:hypothetical protein